MDDGGIGDMGIQAGDENIDDMEPEKEDNNDDSVISDSDHDKNEEMPDEEADDSSQRGRTKPLTWDMLSKSLKIIV